MIGKTYKFAISNFVGESKLYKKFQKKKNGKLIYEKVGNAGSSLKIDKGNVSNDQFEMVKVTSLSQFFKKHNIQKVGIVKIDTEGTEYDILKDIIGHKLYDKIDKICYEDHARKVRSIRKQKDKTLDTIRKLNIQNKIFVQMAHGGDEFSYRQMR
jgi:FkbM family methyltransferase